MHDFLIGAAFVLIVISPALIASFSSTPTDNNDYDDTFDDKDE